MTLPSGPTIRQPTHFPLLGSEETSQTGRGDESNRLQLHQIYFVFLDVEFKSTTTSQLQRQEAFDWASVRAVMILQEGEGALPARAFLSRCTC